MDWAKTTAKQEKYLRFAIGAPYIRGLTVYSSEIYIKIQNSSPNQLHFRIVYANVGRFVQVSMC